MKYIVLILLICGLHFSAFAGVEISEKHIYIYGEFTLEDMDQLKNQFVNANVDPGDQLTVNLNSAGGMLGAATTAFNFFKWLSDTHKVEVVTRVEASQSCNSSCVVIFAAGNKRLASPWASFLIHETPTTGITEENRQSSIKAYLWYLKKASSKFHDWVEEGGFLQEGQHIFFSNQIKTAAPDFLELI